jgi:hypothetical protein
MATTGGNGVFPISRLLTHNTSDFARFAGLITVLPLAG